MGLADYDDAIKMRDIIGSIAKKVIAHERPADKVARVTDFDRASGFASVVYTTDPEEQPVRVRMYPGRQPQTSDLVQGVGNGSVVRISGPVGARYIAEVLSDASHQMSPRSYQPLVAAASIEDSIYATFTLSPSNLPALDGPILDVCAFVMPFGAGIMEIYTRADSDAVQWVMLERHVFDTTVMNAGDYPATQIDQSTTYSGYRSIIWLSNGDLYDRPGQTVVNLSASCTTALGGDALFSPSTLNIMIKFFGMNVELAYMTDAFRP